ncbi:hypothetical protein [Pseudonocardia humida]|uniref:Uncharacterized protein n=1 Tax=Pseudonocardia humida TaxID=2800819 RepID=A0ABT1A350_9PSEU|nr:hypothetical protein [Pseudonocardia humida]MCO1657430.1 hypothetical protein [Pseudonocardia humida]
MDLIIDTSNAKFQVSGDFEPRLDKDRVQRRDKSGGTNLPLWAAKVVAWTDGDAETLLVTVAVENPPKVSQGQFVSIERLQAMPWVQNGNARVAFRAKTIVPLSNGAPAPKPSN